jgi:aspartyl-tRNA(Asn)/glutamyl-tRNA(Gln) amidotransferase subunit A
MSLHLSTAAELGRGLAARQYSSVEVTRHFLDRIGRVNAALNAFVTRVARTRASRAARADRSPACRSRTRTSSAQPAS